MADLVAPEGVDPYQPSAARMYDYYLGGSHNFAADRAAADEVIQLTPLVQPMARSNRDWMRRVVWHLVSEGVRQVIDLGSGIPTVGNVHEAAHAIDPAVRIVYVDIDEVAVAHARLMLADDERVLVVQEDIRDVDTVLATARSIVDFDRPVLVMMSSVLPFVMDDPTPLVDAYVRELCPHSFLAISHASLDGIDPALMPRLDQGAKIYLRAEQPVRMRSYDEISTWFRGLTLLPPGLVRLERWRPETEELPLLPMIAYGGVGQVP